MTQLYTWDLVFYVDDDCKEVWKTVKGLDNDQKKVLSSIMLESAGYCFKWKKSKEVNPIQVIVGDKSHPQPIAFTSCTQKGEQ